MWAWVSTCMLVISCMWRLTTSVAAAGSIGCMAWKPGASLANPSSCLNEAIMRGSSSSRPWIGGGAGSGASK